jgi:hypothetical protein
MSANPLSGWTQGPADMFPVQWSPHSVERWSERVREMEPDVAARELSRMLAGAVVTKSRPDWVKARYADAYLLLGSEIALPLHANRLGELVASTTLTKAMPASDEDRERENAWRRTSRAGKRASRLAQKHSGRRPDHLPSFVIEDA